MADEELLDELLDETSSRTSGDAFEDGQSDLVEKMAAVDEQEAEYVDVLQMRMGGKDFLLAVPDVSEIVRPVALTPVPMAPDHLLGMANIHGQIVCVVEPGRTMNLPDPPDEDSDKTRFVSLRHARMRVAIRVDAVSAIHRLRKDSLPHADAADTAHVCGSVSVQGVAFDVLNAAALLHE